MNPGGGGEAYDLRRGGALVPDLSQDPDPAAAGEPEREQPGGELRGADQVRERPPAIPLDARRTPPEAAAAPPGAGDAARLASAGTAPPGPTGTGPPESTGAALPESTGAGPPESIGAAPPEPTGTRPARGPEASGEPARRSQPRREAAAALPLPDDWQERLRDRLRVLPQEPGVYLFRDARRRVIYVGKAKRLHHRVRSYFRGPAPEELRLIGLRRRIRFLDWIVTTSEVEALILEDSLIKQYAPRFNLRLKDDKRYPYVKVTAGHAFPALVLTRHVAPDGARYFGPFPRVKDLRRVVRTLRAVFRLRNCTDERLARGGRECLEYHIHRCTAPCTQRVDAAGYAAQVQPLLDLLAGRGEEVVRHLEARMRAHAAELRFEESARLRDEIGLLRSLLEDQWLTPPVETEADVVGLAVRGNAACGVFLHVREGRVLGKSHQVLTGVAGRDLPELTRSLLLLSFLHATRVPARLVLAHAPADADDVRLALERTAGHRVTLETPTRGSLPRLLALAARNAHLILEEEELRAAAKRSRVDRSVYALQEALALPHPPYRIEGFDISNLQTTNPVASMVVFRDGRAWKSGYRRYRIRTVEGQDDFAMMAEVLGRRLRRLQEGEGAPPDLILVDGGKGQVAAARTALQEAGFPHLPLIGLAKREEEVILPGRDQPLRLARSAEALRLLQRIRDEAHRFAVGYHRKLRGRGLRASRLDPVPGVGPARRRALLQRFGSLGALAGATTAEIAAVPGIGPRLAARIQAALGTGAAGSGPEGPAEAPTESPAEPPTKSPAEEPAKSPAEPPAEERAEGPAGDRAGNDRQERERPTA